MKENLIESSDDNSNNNKKGSDIDNTSLKKK